MNSIKFIFSFNTEDYCLPNATKKIKNKFYFKDDFQFGITNYQISKEAIVLIISLGITILLYWQHLQIMQLTNSMKELAESQELLKQELLRKESQIQLLEYAVTSSALATDFASSKFYVLPIICFCIGFLGSTYFVTHGFGIASLKSLLPTALCTFIHTYLPFIRIVEKYNVFDEENKIMWLIQIVNRSEANLYGKFLDEEDYLGVNEFLWSILLATPPIG
jgi:hypothetical protein